MDTFLRWPAALDLYEAEIEADCVPLAPVLSAEQRGHIKSAAGLLFHARDEGCERHETLNRAAREVAAAGLDTSPLTVTGPCDEPTDDELEVLEETLRGMLS